MTIDPRASEVFQIAGQDIPWLLDHWAKNKPDHPFLVWEPKSGVARGRVALAPGTSDPSVLPPLIPQSTNPPIHSTH